MSIINQFNNRLNESLKTNRDKSDSFRNYVDVVLKSTMQKNSDFKQALIIGAGKMQDFSLSFFTRYFERVYTTDVDLSTMQNSYEFLELPRRQRPKVILEEVEYTGFDSINFFEDFREKVYLIKTFEEIDSFLSEKLSKLHQYEFYSDKFGKMDFIYVSPIYTQLIYNQILLECSLLREAGYPENLLKYIENVMLDEMVLVIDRFNSNIAHLLSVDGTLFVLSDIFEVNVGSSFCRRVTSSINNRDIMDEIYEQYKEEYGMGLGDFGLFNLDEKVSEVTYKWFIWPMKEDTNLIVKLKIYKKSNLHKEVV